MPAEEGSLRKSSRLLSRPAPAPVERPLKQRKRADEDGDAFGKEPESDDVDRGGQGEETRVEDRPEGPAVLDNKAKGKSNVGSGREDRGESKKQQEEIGPSSFGLAGPVPQVSSAAASPTVTMLMGPPRTTCKDWGRHRLGTCTACLSCDQYQGETMGRCGTTGCGHWSGFHLRKSPTIECKRCMKIDPEGQRCQEFAPLMDNEDLCLFCKHNLDQHEDCNPVARLTYAGEELLVYPPMLLKDVRKLVEEKSGVRLEWVVLQDDTVVNLDEFAFKAGQQYRGLVERVPAPPLPPPPPHQPTLPPPIMLHTVSTYIRALRENGSLDVDAEDLVGDEATPESNELLEQARALKGLPKIRAIPNEGNKEENKACYESVMALLRKIAELCTGQGRKILDMVVLPGLTIEGVVARETDPVFPDGAAMLPGWERLKANQGRFSDMEDVVEVKGYSVAEWATDVIAQIANRGTQKEMSLSKLTPGVPPAFDMVGLGTNTRSAIFLHRVLTPQSRRTVISKAVSLWDDNTGKVAVEGVAFRHAVWMVYRKVRRLKGAGFGDVDLLLEEGSVVDVQVEGGATLQFEVEKCLAGSTKGATYRGRLLNSSYQHDVILKHGAWQVETEADTGLRVVARLMENAHKSHVAALERLRGSASFPQLLAKGRVCLESGEQKVSATASIETCVGEPLGQLDDKAVVRLIIELLWFVDQLWRVGIIHGDLDPRNIVRRKPGMGQIDLPEQSSSPSRDHGTESVASVGGSEERGPEPRQGGGSTASEQELDFGLVDFDGSFLYDRKAGEDLVELERLPIQNLLTQPYSVASGTPKELEAMVSVFLLAGVVNNGESCLPWSKAALAGDQFTVMETFKASVNLFLDGHASWGLEGLPDAVSAVGREVVKAWKEGLPVMVDSWLGKLRQAEKTLQGPSSGGSTTPPLKVRPIVGNKPGELQGKKDTFSFLGIAGG